MECARLEGQALALPQYAIDTKADGLIHRWIAPVLGHDGRDKRLAYGGVGINLGNHAARARFDQFDFDQACRRGELQSRHVIFFMGWHMVYDEVWPKMQRRHFIQSGLRQSRIQFVKTGLRQDIEAEPVCEWMQALSLACARPQRVACSGVSRIKLQKPEMLARDFQEGVEPPGRIVAHIKRIDGVAPDGGWSNGGVRSCQRDGQFRQAGSPQRYTRLGDGWFDPDQMGNLSLRLKTSILINDDPPTIVGKPKLRHGD